MAAQDDEARFRPGTNKWVAFKVLREAGSEGLSVPQIMARSKQAGLKQWDDNAKRIIQFVRPCRPWPCSLHPLHHSDAQAQGACVLLPQTVGMLFRGSDTACPETSLHRANKQLTSAGAGERQRVCARGEGRVRAACAGGQRDASVQVARALAAGEPAAAAAAARARRHAAAGGVRGRL